MRFWGTRRKEPQLPAPGIMYCRCGAVFLVSDSKYYEEAMEAHFEDCDKHEFEGWAIHKPTSRVRRGTE